MGTQRGNVRLPPVGATKKNNDEFATFKRNPKEIPELYPKFWEALQEHFPGAIPSGVGYFGAVGQITEELNRYGFTKQNTIPVVSQCRDELTKPFMDTIEDYWGDSFDISSLAGMVFCGETGFMAAMSHAPQDEFGTERYLFIAGPHIAIGPDGTIGEVLRDGRSEATTACGALKAFGNEFNSGKLQVELCYNDLEQSLVKQSLLSYLPLGQPTDLVKLTKAAQSRIYDDVERTLKATVDHGQKREYAVISGVLVHGPDHVDYFWVNNAEVTDQKGTFDILPYIMGDEKHVADASTEEHNYVKENGVEEK